MFPLAKRPADQLVSNIALGAPIQITGLVAWLTLAAVYVVDWAAAPLFVPIGYQLLRVAEDESAH